MSVIKFGKKDASKPTGTPTSVALLSNASIEVMPRTAAKVESFANILPPQTRVYIAHIEGTPIEDMVDTAKRIAGEGFAVMPHFPARIIADKSTLADWIARYQGEAGVDQALVLAGGVKAPHGDFESSMQLLETGLFDQAGFTRLHVAGHPEGNRDIDPDGGEAEVTKALEWKNAFAERSDASFALATQFVFDPAPVLDWSARLQAAGIDMPIHLGVAGPAKLQTLIKFAIACGVGPSLNVLKKRAKDVTKLLLPFTPDDVVDGIADGIAGSDVTNIESIHLFPLGGIKTSADWLADRRGGVLSSSATG